LDGKTTGTGVHESQSRSQWALIDCVDRTPGGAAFACCCDCRRRDNYRPPRSGLPVSNIPTKKADSSSIINHLARRGFIQPGAYKGSRISWTNSYIGERIAWGIITADMSGASEGWFHIQLGQLDQQITLIVARAISAAGNGISYAHPTPPGERSTISPVLMAIFLIATAWRHPARVMRVS
jgi:hypothetical protein